MQLARDRRALAQLLIGCALLAAIGLADCTFMQILAGDLDQRRTLLWTGGTLLPLSAAAFLIWIVPLRRFSRAHLMILLGSAALAALIVIVSLDVLLFPADSAVEWTERARSKAPGVAAFLALGSGAHWFTRQAASHDAPHQGSPVSHLSPADKAALVRADLVQAAGNYVEARQPGRPGRLIRITLNGLEHMAEAEGLVRLHRSTLVRTSAIFRWHNDRHGLVAAELHDGTIVRVGRNYRSNAYAVRSSCASSPHA